MLKLVWTPAPAGPPDGPGAAAARDVLSSPDAQTPVQSFLRADTAFQPAAAALTAALTSWTQARPDPAAPVFVLVHGYLYDPTRHFGAGQDDPFALVYGYPGQVNPATGQKLDPTRSWLPLVGECDDAGGNRAETAIAFAWVSEASLAQFAAACWDGDYKYAALDLAPAAAKALAAVLASLAEHGTRVRILAHSLGTRLTSQAIGLLDPARTSTIERIVLLDGSEYCVDAAANFSTQGFDSFSLANRQDLVLMAGAEAGCHPVRPTGSLSACVIGYTGLGGHPRWLDLQLDSEPFRDWARRGFAPTGVAYGIDPKVENPTRPIDALNHWCCYTNPGNRVFVRDLLRHPAMTVARLQGSHVPAGVNSAAYGQFNGQPIPATPQTCGERRNAGTQPPGGGGN